MNTAQAVTLVATNLTVTTMAILLAILLAILMATLILLAAKKLYMLAMMKVLEKATP